MTENTVEGSDEQGHLLQSEDETRLSGMLGSLFTEPPADSPAFFGQPKPYADLDQVATGVPTTPWAVYKKDGGGFLEVKYDPLLQCVTTRDVASYPVAVYCHLYVIMTHLKLLGHGELPAVLVLLATLAATEFVGLLRAAYALEEAMEADNFIARMNKCARSSLLAGCAMLCDLGKGLNEVLGENEYIRTYVTWVVRGTLPGIWRTASILLPLPGGSTCRIEAKDVAYCAAADADFDTPYQVCCAVSFYGDDASNGDTCVGLQPELRDAFLEEAESFGVPLPSTFYEKGGTGYVRAVGAGIAGLPIL
eukprot:g6165.t1